MASAAAAKKCPRLSQWFPPGGGLEGVARRLGGHAHGGEFPQLVVDEREQIARGLPVAGRGGIEQMGRVGPSTGITFRLVLQGVRQWADFSAG